MQLYHGDCLLLVDSLLLVPGLGRLLLLLDPLGLLLLLGLEQAGPGGGQAGGLEDWKLEDWRTGGLEVWRTGGLEYLRTRTWPARVV